MAIPGLFLSEYAFAIISIFIVLCLMLYSYIRREAIAKKCDQEDEKNKALEEAARVYAAELEAKIESGEYIFSERTARILEKIFNPIFWVISLVLKIAERFYSTRPGKRITGFLSLCYYFLKSVEQKTCILVKVE